MTKNQFRKRRALWENFVLIALTTCACEGSRVDIIQSQIAAVTNLATDTHRLKDIRVFQDGSKLVVFGKVEQTQGFCITPGWVDLAIVKEDKVIYQASIPHRRGNHRNRGWYGADFRARLPIQVQRDAEIRLIYHGDTCHSGETFEVARNLAVPGNASRQ